MVAPPDGFGGSVTKPYDSLAWYAMGFRPVISANDVPRAT